MRNLLANAKNDFPIFERKPLTYLDTAATAQKPCAVIDAVKMFYSEEYGTVHRAVYTLSQEATHRCDLVRQKVQHFLNAKEKEEIIFTKGTTESINLVASSFGKAFVKPGDEILITEIEHHANLVPWQILCEEKGAHLKVIPVDDEGTLKLETLDTLLTPKTKLVALSHISNSLGTIHPIRKMTKRAHEVGAVVLVDGAQAAPHLPIDVQDLGADFYAFSGHKCYGPTGIGVLYGKKELLEAMPPYQAGGDMIERVTIEKTTYQNPPLRFEAGTPMIAEIIGLGAAIDYLQALGLEKIHDHSHQLVTTAQEKLQTIPAITLYGSKDRGALISFNIDGIHPLDLGTFLNLKGIAIRTGHLCSQTTMQRFKTQAVARISFGVYNTLNDINTFIEALDQVCDALWK